MALMIPAPAGSTGWGRSILDTVVALESQKTRKEISEKEIASRKIYYNALGRQVTLAEKKHEEEAELRREVTVAKISGAKLSDIEAQRKLKMIQDINDEEYEAYTNVGNMLKIAQATAANQRSAASAANQETNLLKTLLATQAQKHKQETDKLNQNIDTLGRVAGSDAYGSVQFEVAAELLKFYQAQGAGGDTSNLVQPSESLAKLKAGEEKKHDRDVKDQTARERRAQVGKESLRARKAGELTGDDKADYDSLSWLQVRDAEIKELPKPEVRRVDMRHAKYRWYVPFESMAMEEDFKLVTRSAAMQLGILDEWDKAGPLHQESAQSTKKTEEGIDFSDPNFVEALVSATRK